MHRSIRVTSPSPRLASVQRAIDSIDARLDLAHPDLETEKIRRVIEILFGTPPEIRDFGLSSAPPPSASFSSIPSIPAEGGNPSEL